MPAPHPPSTPPPNLSTLWGRVVIDELARCGLRWAVIAPGSRSTPLALAAADHPDVADLSVIDERAAAFVALGLAKATGRPAAVITTSGTAAANLLPAVAEADRSAVPLLALTADRPARLRDAGDSQATDQVKLFGDRVRWFHETPEPALPPGAEEVRLRALRSAACHAWAAARGLGPRSAPGPVHLNLPFDKPLEPTPATPGTAGALTTAAEGGFTVERSPAVAGRPGGAPWRRTVGGGAGAVDREPVDELVDALLAARRPLVVTGALQGACDPSKEDRLGLALARLAAALPLPVWAEAASGLRFGAPAGGAPIGPTEPTEQAGSARPARSLETVATTELLLASRRFREALTGDRRPDLVLRLGEAPIGWAGRRLAAAWAEAGVEQIAIDPWGRRLDPEHGLTRVLVADPAALLEAVAARLLDRAGRQGEGDSGGDGAPGWLAFHRAADQAARQALDEALAGEKELFDGGVFWHLGRTLPEDTALVVSSSMPLRELEVFLPACPAGPIDVFANRGHNGIDGVTATALGVALGRRALGRSRTVLVTGDVAFAHDLSGALAAGRLREHADPVLVLVDNGGGAIFDHLPAAGHEPGFTRHLATPPGADFAALARGCGLDPAGETPGGYQAPATWDALRQALESALAIGGAGPRLIHIRTDRARSKALRQAIIDRVGSSVDRAVDREGAEAAKARRREPGRPAEPDPVAPVERPGDSASGRRQRTEAPLLFLHGFTGSRRDWIDWVDRVGTIDRVVPSRPIGRAATGRRFAGHPALAIDLPGHGLAPVPAAGATLDEAIAAVLRALDREGTGRAHLVGYSMGGRVALATAVRHPDRLASLTLIGTSPGIEDDAARRARRESDEALAHALEQDGLEAFVDHWMAQPIFASQLRLGHRALRRARLARLAGSARGYAASLRGMGQGAQPSLWSALPALPVPTLVLAGARDEKYTRLAHAMAERLPDARVEIVPDAGHAAHLEAPETVANLLRGWLE